MPRNRVQHQKGLSDDAFEQRYPDEETCRKAWFAWRWPEGFKCPRCAASEYCEIRDRQLLQCPRCRYQTSLIAGTVLQGTKLPMRVWLRAMQQGIVHERHVTGSDRRAARHPAFRWANTMLANIKNSLLATHRVVAAKHLPRYLGAFAWRFNRRFVLKTIHERLAIAATTTPPMPYRLLKLAEARW